MKTIKQLFAGLFIILSFTVSCSRDDVIVEIMEDPEQQNPTNNEDPDGSENPDSGEAASEISVNVVLPEGSDLDLSKTKLVSFTKSFEVTADGSTNALLFPEERSFVYLEDEEEEVLLMGFINDSKKEISIESTAQAALFFSLGSVFQFPEVIEMFFNEYSTIQGIDAFSTSMANLFVNNPNFLLTQEFQDLISDKTSELLGGKELVDIGTKVLLNDSSTKSGINVLQAGQYSVKFQNRWRRRAHAFLYKTAIKKEGETEFTTILPDIVGTNAITTNQKYIEAPTGITSAVGGAVEVVAGNGQNMGFVLTSPNDLERSAGEVQVKYKARVVGPHGKKKPKDVLTSDELLKWEDLTVRTVILDLIIPLASTAIGYSPNSGIESLESLEKTLEIANTIFRSTPGAWEAAFEGNYTKAYSEFMKALNVNIATSELFYTELAKTLKHPNYGNIEFARFASKTAKILKAIDAFLTVGDAGRILALIGQAKEVEEWEITTTESNVVINPRQVSLIPGRSRNIEAKVLNDDIPEGQSVEYEWTSTGTFGDVVKLEEGIRDGVSGSKESFSKAKYTSRPNSNLPDDAQDIIQVKAYLIEDNGERTLIGEDTSIARIFETEWRIEPEKITTSGNSIVAFRLTGTNAHYPPFSVARVKWSTSGKYGKFNGLVNNLEVLGEDVVFYHALDTEVDKGIEDITATLYYVNPGDMPKEIGKDQTTITIENNPLKKIFYVYEPTIDGTAPHINAVNGFCEWSVWADYEFNPIDPAILEAENKEVVSYELTIKAAAPDLIPTLVGKGETWEISNGMDLPPEYFYSYRYAVTGSQGPATNCDTIPSSFISVLDYYEGFAGYAEIVATLKYKD